MNSFLKAILKTDEVMQIIAGVALTFIVLLTTVDVVLRAFGRPVSGVYEIVAMGGGIVIGFGIPLTSWRRGHIYVDFLIQKLPAGKKDVINIITRCIGIALFVMIGWNVFRIAGGFMAEGEVSPTLQIPFYPVAYGVGFCFFMLSVVLVCDIVRILGGDYE